MPLHAQGKPVAVGLNRFDHAIKCLRAHAEPPRHALHGTPMLTVDDDFPVAIEVGQNRIRYDVNGVAQSAFGWMAMLQRLR